MLGSIAPIRGCLLITILLAGLGGCRTTRPPTSRTDPTTTPVSRTQLEHELEMAQLRAAFLRTTLEHDNALHAERITTARTQRDEARNALDYHLQIDAPARQAAAEDAMADARHKLDKARDALASLQATINDDPNAFHPTTRDTLLRRARQSVDQATRSLDTAQQNLHQLVNIELPRTKRRLELAVLEHDRSLLELQRSHEATHLARQAELVDHEARILQLHTAILRADHTPTPDTPTSPRG